MSKQFGRKASLIVYQPDGAGLNPDEFIPGRAMDLSQMHFQFRSSQADAEAPNNCTIRVFNLSENTVQTILRNDFSRVILQAGYEGQFGVIFDGTVKQFRTGRLSQTDTFLDILAADGDLGYNFAVANGTLSAEQNTDAGRKKLMADTFAQYGVSFGNDLTASGGTRPNPRGKTVWAMGRVMARQYAETKGATWSITNGKINVIPLDGYLPGEAVKLSTGTGLVGIPEQTQDGIKCQCLLNPKIIVGGRIQIDNKLINQTFSQNSSALGVGQLPFNQWVGVQFLATVRHDGFYRVYVAEHVGDTRGKDWYTNIVALAIDASSQKVKPYG